MKEVTRDGMFVVEPPSPRPANAAELEKKTRAMFEDWNRISTPEKMLNDLRGQVVKALKVKPPALTRKPRTTDKRYMEARERRRKDLQSILKEIDWLLRTHETSSRNHVDFFNLGMLACKANVRLIEPEALRGMNQLGHCSEGGKAKAEQTREKWDIWLKDAAELREKKPHWSGWRISRALSGRYEDDRELSGKPDTIYKKIHK
jgi:hypothetical protein